MDSENVIWAGMIAASLVGLVIYLVRRPSRAELVAVLETSHRARVEADVALKTITHMRSQGLIERLGEGAARKIERSTVHHLDGVTARTEVAFDNEFYVKSLKAVFPKESWRAECESRFLRLRAEADERHTWAASRLGTATLA